MNEVSESADIYKDSSTRYLVTFVCMVLSFLSILAILGAEASCSGAQVSLSAKVDASCTEHRSAPGEAPQRADLVTLDCPQIGGSGSITITMSRAHWMGISDPGSTERYLPDGGHGQVLPKGK